MYCIGFEFTIEKRCIYYRKWVKTDSCLYWYHTCNHRRILSSELLICFHSNKQEISKSVENYKMDKGIYNRSNTTNLLLVHLWSEYQYSLNQHRATYLQLELQSGAILREFLHSRQTTYYMFFKYKHKHQALYRKPHLKPVVCWPRWRECRYYPIRCNGKSEH